MEIYVKKTGFLAASNTLPIEFHNKSTLKGACGKISSLIIRRCKDRSTKFQLH